MAESGQKYHLPFTADAYPRLLAIAIAKAREAWESSVESLVEVLRGKAHRWPPDWNQMPEVHEAHRRLIDEVVVIDHPYPAERFAGRGIVTVAGGKYAASGYVLCRVLRELGCRLPIQVWHLGAAEIDGGMRRLLLAIDGIELVDAHERLAGRPRIFGGWQAKIWAIMESPFREVLYLDADNVPIRDPSYLFEQVGHVGAMLWPDLHNRPGMDITEQGFITAGLPVPGRSRDPKHDKPTDYDPVESGQILVEKRTCWQALHLVRHLNDHSDYWFPQAGGRRQHWHCYGDKSTFYLGFERAGKYVMPGGPDWIGDSRGGAFVQRDLDGVPVFQHRCQPPGKLQVAGVNIHPPGFVGADMIERVLAELRRDWSNGFGDMETEACDAAMLAAIPGDYEWFQGPRRRPMMLLDGGRTMDNRHSWAARRRDGVTYLAITADDGVTSLLGETRDGSWCRHDRDEFLVRAPPPSWHMIRERSELGMYGDIVHANEYRLPDRFDPTDTILDIGAHVGVFAHECLRRGCGRIVCVEPCSDNFEYLASNLRSWGHNAILIRAAAWIHGDGIRLGRPPGGEHTGGAAVSAEAPWPVPSIDILDLLRLAGDVRLLKLDCEGSEWPILWRADLSRVRSIAMEWHAAWLGGIEALTGERYGIDALVARLVTQGFKVESIVNPEAPKLGHLFACR